MTTRATTRQRANIDDIRDYIVATEKVAHVSFYLVRDKDDPFEEDYFVYSESKERGLEQLNDLSIPYHEAQADLQIEIERFNALLDKKRKGMPTSKQVYFLFIHKIPIPIDLTWGQASDLIDERINQEQQAQRQKQAERFDGFTVGQRITFQFFNPKTQEPRLVSATITKLTGNNRSARYMYVEYDNNTPGRWPLNGLPKIVDKGTTL